MKTDVFATLWEENLLEMNVSLLEVYWVALVKTQLYDEDNLRAIFHL